jgi:hypothetical protein
MSPAGTDEEEDDEDEDEEDAPSAATEKALKARKTTLFNIYKSQHIQGGYTKKKN